MLAAVGGVSPVESTYHGRNHGATMTESEGSNDMLRGAVATVAGLDYTEAQVKPTCLTLDTM